MMDSNAPSSSALVVGPSDPSRWQVVLVGQGEGRHCVLYHASSRSFAVSRPTTTSGVPLLDDNEDDDEVRFEQLASPRTTPTRRTNSGSRGRAGVGPNVGLASSSAHSRSAVCPLCRQQVAHQAPRQRTLVPQGAAPALGTGSDAVHRAALLAATRTTESRYFALLDEANSRSNTPTTTRDSHNNSQNAHEQPLLDETLNTGYLRSFFQELGTLGRGGSGSVVKVQHVMQGEKLGVYALKKVAVGDSTLSLLRILREVHLLESVQHTNIVTYHHAWVENSQQSPYSPSVPTLHILMQYANGGSLDSFINRRRGVPPAGQDPDDGNVSPARRKERFRMRKLGAVHLLRLDEILDLFEDITHGLAFLHSRNILHLDLKAENVLLHWDEDALLPTAKLSDFGNATSDTYHRERQGGSGTLAYLAPETWEHDTKSGKLRSADRAVDQWALGLILHLLAFFALPYRNEHDMRLLEQEIQAYRGFFPEDASWLDHGTRHDLPLSLLRLVSKLVNRTTSARPSAEKVLVEIARMRDDMLTSRFELPLESHSTALVRVGPSSDVSNESEMSADVQLSPNRRGLHMSLSYHHDVGLSMMLVIAASLAKVFMLLAMCRAKHSAQWTSFALVFSVLADVAVQSPRVTALLLLGHVTAYLHGMFGIACSF
ncbi:hypothetical protein ACM66B_004313 [Microbotryomycetes sp. NB124-2]